jgi:hemin uptake protein HemP
MRSDGSVWTTTSEVGRISMPQMNIDSSEQRHKPAVRESWSQRRRIRTIDLMQGARQIILLHEGEEYLLRITKTGKLILTK